MKARGKKLLAAMLSLAMVLSMFVVPASATEPQVLKTWDIENAASGVFDGTFTAESPSELDGLKLVGTGRRQTGQGFQLSTSAYVEIPVEGNCQIKVYTNYKLNLYLGDDSSKAVTDTNKVVVLTYKGAAGTVNLCTADGQNCYITKIELLEYQVAAPALTLSSKDGVIVKMGNTATVTATVDYATKGTVTATSVNTGVVTVDDTSGDIVLTPVTAGKTTVNVSVAISNAEDGTTTGPLTASFPVWVVAADPGKIAETGLAEINFRSITQEARTDLVFGTPGVEFPLDIKLENGEGPHGANPVVKIHMPDGKQGDIVISNCGYSSGNQVTMEASSGTMTSANNETAEGGNYGKTWTVAGAKGTTTLTFAGNNVYIHSLKVVNITDATTDPEPDPGPGDTFEEKTWTFTATAADNGNALPLTVLADGSQDQADKLTFTPDSAKNGFAKYHDTTYMTQFKNCTISVPVPGECNIVLGVGYAWDVQLGDDAGTRVLVKKNGGDGKTVTLYYTGAAGTATLNIGGDATTYIQSIKVVAPTDPVANLIVDKESVALEMGKTETAEVTTTVGYVENPTVTATSKDTTVATVSAVANGKFTITAVDAGNTTVEVAVGAVKKEITVAVKAAQTGPVYFKDGLTSFVNKTAADVDLIDGFAYTGFSINGKHGIQGDSGATITLNLKKKGTITVTGCCYGKSMTVTSSVGEVTMTEGTEEEGTKPPVAVIKDAEGEVTLIFAGTTYVHSIDLTYPVVAEDRKIDVWDFAAAAATGENYNNNITAADWSADLFKADSQGKFKVDDEVTFGDLTVNYKGDDRLYSSEEDLSAIAFPETKFTNTYADGYAAKGGYYANGNGGNTRRYVTITHVAAGDKIVAYLGSTGSDPTTYDFQGQGAAGGQTDKGTVASGAYEKFEFVAQHDGTYKIWAEATSSQAKPLYQRIVRFPGVNVSGSIDIPAGFSATNYTVKFVNQANKQETEAVVDKAAKTYTVTLAPGFTYTVSLSGATGWGFSADTRTLTTTDAESMGDKTANLKMEAKPVFTYAGTITGFDDGFDATNLVITMIPADPAASDPVELTINADKTFTATLDAGMAYTLKMEGANDYAITAPAEVKLTANAAGQTITVEAKDLQTVSGKFLGLGEGVTVTALKFKNVEDSYEYTATVANGGYTAKLRAGAYEAVATVSGGGYTTISHVVVADKAVTKDLLFAAPADTSPLTWVKDVYVGYPDQENNYATVNDAVKTVARMGVSSEAKRVTIHIAPGTYREQVIINTPYITLTNDKAGEVLLTWYYGIGYKYYSSNGYYDAQRAFDKYEKKIADRWGTTVRVNKSATGFRAEGITFENSFNRYVTDEEIADGVEPALIPSASPITLERNKELDVTSKAATERAAAMCVETDQAEFFDCAFLSSQDTVYTAGDTKGCQGRIYFKNCFIEGQTDYIFGSGSVVFDDCTLSWKGYSDEKPQTGHITAVRPDDTPGCKGYLFRGCTVVANPGLTVAPGDWGRPWGANAMVTFLNTKLEKADLIIPAGWVSMSGAQPENANFHEFGTTALDGAAVDTSKRVEGTVMTEAEANAVTAESYFNGWTPYYYGTETRTVTFQADTGANVTDLTENDEARVLNSRNQLVALKDAVVTFKIAVDEGYALTGVTGATWENDIYTVNADTVVISARSTSSSGGSGGNVPSSNGSKTQTVTNSDGSKTTTKTDRKGNTTVTTVAADGSKVETYTTKAGDKTITVTDAKGEVQVKLELPAAIPAPETKFADVPEGHWAEESINRMAGLGTIQGIGGGNYDMNSPITRGSVATILYRLSNVEVDGSKGAFTDVESGDWYAEAVAWASSTGVVTGYSESIFAPKDSIDRQQLAVMLYRYAKLLRLDTTTEANLKQFQDAADVADWAADAMSWCVGEGILKGNGYGSLNPTGTASRAECATMLDRFIGLL